MTKEEFNDAKSLWKFMYAYDCFTKVKETCEFIKKECVDENSSVYYSLTSGIYALYSKPFTSNENVGKLTDKIIPEDYKDLHQEILNFRNKLFAHLDPQKIDYENEEEEQKKKHITLKLPKQGSLAVNENPNQVRFIVTDNTFQMYATQLKVKPPHLDNIKQLCEKLIENVNYRKKRLLQKYKRYIAKYRGESYLNIYNENDNFVMPSSPLATYSYNYPTL